MQELKTAGTMYGKACTSLACERAKHCPDKVVNKSMQLTIPLPHLLVADESQFKCVY